MNISDARRFGKDAVIDGEESQQSNRSDESSNSTNSSRSLVSNSAFADGNNMNSGNVLTDRPSFRVLNLPGGKSTVFLG